MYRASPIIWCLAESCEQSQTTKAGLRWGRVEDVSRMLCEGGGLPAEYAWEWLTLFRLSPWLWLVVLSQEWSILANQITATRWTHRQWIFTQLTCILFYCQNYKDNFSKYNKKFKLQAAMKRPSQSMHVGARCPPACSRNIYCWGSRSFIIWWPAPARIK